MTTVVVPSVLAVDVAVSAGDVADEEVEAPIVVPTSTPGAGELVVDKTACDAEGTPEDSASVASDANGAVPASVAQAFTRYSNVHRDERGYHRTRFRWMFVSRT